MEGRYNALHMGMVLTVDYRKTMRDQNIPHPTAAAGARASKTCTPQTNWEMGTHLDLCRVEIESCLTAAPTDISRSVINE